MLAALSKEQEIVSLPLNRPVLTWPLVLAAKVLRRDVLHLLASFSMDERLLWSMLKESSKALRNLFSW